MILCISKSFRLTAIMGFLFLTVNAWAQYQVNGTAVVVDDNCFRLTPEEDGAVGSVWFTEQIDLRQSFNLRANIHLGCNDGNGADGMVFGLQAISTSVGTGGYGMGFAGINPSLGVEFDTHENGDVSDPDFDHIAIIRNGDVGHLSGNNLAGPIQIRSGENNVEDCEFYEVQFTWDVNRQVFSVFFDCEFRLSYQGDLVQSIFNGDPFVFWGFTAGTGASNNEQIICIEQLEFVEPLADVILCPGGQVQLQAAPGFQYKWSPASGLSATNIANPIASPNTNTSYFVELSKTCQATIYDTIDITVDGNMVDFNFEDTTLCAGAPLLLDAFSNNPTATYLWSDGSMEETIQPQNSGTYSLTVTLNDYCISTDRAIVTFLEFPTRFFLDHPDICPNETISLDATFDEATYLWQDDSTEPIYQVSSAGEYRVTINHFCGQKTLSADISQEVSCTDVYIPNAFSPNRDGTNDFFLIYDGGDIVNINRLHIFDRWGGLVYENKNFPANDLAYAWNGSFKGQIVAAGVYVYWIEILFRNNETLIFSGDLTILH